MENILSLFSSLRAYSLVEKLTQQTSHYICGRCRNRGICIIFFEYRKDGVIPGGGKGLIKNTHSVKNTHSTKIFILLFFFK